MTPLYTDPYDTSYYRAQDNYPPTQGAPSGTLRFAPTIATPPQRAPRTTNYVGVAPAASPGSQYPYDPAYDEQELARIAALHPAPDNMLGLTPASTVAVVPSVLPTEPTPTPAPMSQFGSYPVAEGVDPMQYRAAQNKMSALGLKNLFGMQFKSPSDINVGMDTADVSSISYTPEYRDAVAYLTPLLGADGAAKAATYNVATRMGAGGALSNSLAWQPVVNTMNQSAAELNAGTYLTGNSDTADKAFPYVGAGRIQATVDNNGGIAFLTPDGQDVSFGNNISPAQQQAVTGQMMSAITQPQRVVSLTGTPTGASARARAGVSAVPSGGLAGAVTTNNAAQVKQSNALALQAAKAQGLRVIAEIKVQAAAIEGQLNRAQHGSARQMKLAADKAILDRKLENAIAMYGVKVANPIPKAGAGAPIQPKAP